MARNALDSMRKFFDLISSAKLIPLPAPWQRIDAYGTSLIKYNKSSSYYQYWINAPKVPFLRSTGTAFDNAYLAPIMTVNTSSSSILSE